MFVNVTQFKMPDGRAVQTGTDLPDELQPHYDEMRRRGWRFEAEMLSTGDVSITIADDETDQDIRIVANGPGVQDAMVEMLRALLPQRGQEGKS